MSLFLSPRNKGTVAISICNRCQKKMHYADLKKDPNNGQFYCEDCVDVFDPWRNPARKAEDIALSHPRPDIKLEDA